MRSERVQKRQSLSPPTVRAAADLSHVGHARLRWWERVPVWIGLLLLAGLAVWTSFVLHREIERSVADELKLVLSAQIELAHALIGPSDEPEIGSRFAGVLARLPVLSRIGRTGEAYAFDRRGVMLSPSRFEAELRERDLLQRRDGKNVVELRDPGGRVAAGYQPSVPRAQQPFTKMVREALAGRDGLDLDGYRDYRGALVVGAWKWLPRYDLGVAVEIDADEAFSSNDGLRNALFALYVLMALALLALGGSSRMYARAKTEIAHAKQLGQYTLVRELGRGGMGTVYEARHALLRRPTAVKLMSAPSPARAQTGDAPVPTDPVAAAEAVLRFEREVQLTSQLSHPNTVVIYDYGRTDDGVFYYAMEYIDGVDLDHLIRVDGPLPPGRVLHLALQICGSLAEAHDKSLIHRDIKPANILVCERGGMPDYIKVLDFGLVKSLLGPQVSAAHVLVGTPQFMAPEVLRDPSRADARSDIYAVGAVLYWLSTGHTIFEATHPLAALQANAKVKPPSELRPDLPVDLERIIMRCLAREPMERPLSMSALAQELRACRAYGSWSTQDARRYWRERGSSLVKDWPAAPDVPTLAAH